MYLLDTDHLTILERGGPESVALRARLTAARPQPGATTIISDEEQTRGWLSSMAQARALDKQVAAYARVQHLTNVCAIPLRACDEEAARMLRQLRRLSFYRWKQWSCACNAVRSMCDASQQHPLETSAVTSLSALRMPFAVAEDCSAGKIVADHIVARDRCDVAKII